MKRWPRSWPPPACAPTTVPGSCRSTEEYARAAEEQLRRHGERGRPRGRRHHGGAFLSKFTEGPQVGAPRYRRHRLARRRAEGQHRPPVPLLVDFLMQRAGQAADGLRPRGDACRSTSTCSAGRRARARLTLACRFAEKAYLHGSACCFSWQRLAEQPGSMSCCGPSATALRSARDLRGEDAGAAAAPGAALQAAAATAPAPPVDAGQPQRAAARRSAPVRADHRNHRRRRAASPRCGPGTLQGLPDEHRARETGLRRLPRAPSPPAYRPAMIALPMDKALRPARHRAAHLRGLGSARLFPPSGSGPAYCIVIPPPNVTGTLHMGHAFQDTIMDALIRYQRMRGHDTLWQSGTDHAGIATQMVVERQLEAAGQSRSHAWRARQFVARVWEWKEQSGGTICAADAPARRLGDWTRDRFTMDPGAVARGHRSLRAPARGRADLPRQAAGELGPGAADGPVRS